MSDFKDFKGQDDNNDFDVIIVGAGLTGLTAAYSLLKKEIGLDVLILEASENIGGRIFLTAESKSFHAHPLQRNITAMLEELNIKSVPKRQSQKKDKIFLTKRGPFSRLSSYISAQVYNFLASIQNISTEFQSNIFLDEVEANNLAKMSLDQLSSYFMSRGAARSICQSLLCTSCGISNLQKVSALWYLLLVNGAGGFLQRLKVALGDRKRFFLVGGMAELIQKLSNKITKKQGVINCSEPVSLVQFNNTRAYVTTNKKCYKCEYVVIAVPPPESAGITIQPSLSPILSKVQTLFENGTNVFFTATFGQEFRNDNYNYPANIIATPDSDSSLKFVYDATHSSNKSQLVLAGFLSESDSQTLKKFKLFDTLNKCFRSNVAENCRVYKEHKWIPLNSPNDQEAIRGGSPMSFLIPCDFKNHFNPLALTNSRIFYAASEYAKNWPGTADGAIEAGKTTSFAILWRIRPQSLNRSDLASFSIRPRRFRQIPIRFSQIYYLCLAANICIFWSFLKKAY